MRTGSTEGSGMITSFGLDDLDSREV